MKIHQRKNISGKAQRTNLRPQQQTFNLSYQLTKVQEKRMEKEVTWIGFTQGKDEKQNKTETTRVVI